MRTLLRLGVVLVVLSTSGATQVLASGGAAAEACCPGERESEPAPDCPPGSACACCPARSSIPLVATALRPLAPAGRAVAASAPAPVGAGFRADIFHPPRA